ncbi:MAG: response regulator [Elusimicrobiota bacterium]|jgi:signal transduction histidine kinase/CheY-like chemotaxis protein
MESVETVHREEEKKGTANRILVVDDEVGIRDFLSNELLLQGYQVDTAADGAEALSKIHPGAFQVVICDINMPRMSGIDFLAKARRCDPDLEVIMATGYATIESAVETMKRGAYDFVQKPFNINELLAIIEKCLEKSELKALMAVYEASRSVFQSVELASLLPHIADLSKQLLRADDVSILLMDSKGHLSVAAAAGLENEARRSARLALGARIAGKVAESREPVLFVASLKNDSRFTDSAESKDIQSSIVYPLILQEELLGVLNVNRTRQSDPFTPMDLRMVTIFSSQIAQAVHNAHLYERLAAKVTELETAKKQLEEAQMQLIQSEKLAGIGQLAAGVAHELNNPLSGVLGFSQLLLDDPKLTAQQRKDVETIHAQSQRCRVIIQNLLQFSRRKEPRKEAINLIPLIQATLDLVKYDFSTSGIEIIQKFPDSLPLVFGDSHQLQQVFLNIITNARQAMEGSLRGQLSIEAKTDAKEVMIEFIDTGDGIPPELMGKIFDPFFTTKAPGKGTGLGLSICYGIIQQHHGELKVKSAVHAGTTFTLQFPVYE